MKKILAALSLVIITVLVACQSSVGNDVFITKYYESSVSTNNAIELYNSSSKKVNLSSLSLVIYANGSNTATYTIQLDGSIEANDYYIITNVSALNADLKDKSNLSSKDLLFNGNDVVALQEKDRIVDIIGSMGFNGDFGKDVTLVKKLSKLQAYEQYDASAYIPYLPDKFDMLKSMEGVISEEALLDGPILTDTYRNDFTFIDARNPNLGGGGVMTVTLINVSDGDTATFYNSELNLTLKVRYAFIDTREVVGTGSATGQDWAYPASALNKSYLEVAKNTGQKIEIQSIKGQQLKDQYDRYLGLIWVDSKLVNFAIARAGMTIFNGDVTEGVNQMSYNGVAFHGYIFNAVNRAIKNVWGVHGEVDSNWDYDRNRPINTNTAPGSPITPDRRLYNPEIDA